MRLIAILFSMLVAFLASAAQADPADIAAASRSVVRVVLISQYNDDVRLQGHGSGVAVRPIRKLSKYSMTWRQRL